MDIRRLVGENVRRYRLAAKLSQEALAARMEVEQGYISRLEAGTRNPTIGTLQELADALGVQPVQLLEVPPSKGPSARRR